MCDNFGCDPYYGIKFAIFIVVMIVGLGINIGAVDHIIRKIRRK